jgi:hypothetical protein
LRTLFDYLVGAGTDHIVRSLCLANGVLNIPLAHPPTMPLRALRLGWQSRGTFGQELGELIVNLTS